MMMHHLLRTQLIRMMIGSFIVLGPGSASFAARPEAPSTIETSKWLDPLHYYRTARTALATTKPPEIVEMFMAVAGGSDMGPGEGWFHGSQSRYNWSWLAGRHGRTARAKGITRAEFRGPSEFFDRLDRDHDGRITSADFDWSDRSAYIRQGGPASYWFYSVDSNSNGRISKEEWLAAFQKASGSKGYLTPTDLRELFPLSPPRPQGPPPKNAGPSPFTLVKGLLSGELGSMFEGPRINDVAPEFSLKTQNGSEQIWLSQFRGKKPVVLVFGSFT